MRYREAPGLRLSEIGSGAWIVGGDLYRLDGTSRRPVTRATTSA